MEPPIIAAGSTQELLWAAEAGQAGATHRGLVFVEHLVVAAERDAEDDGRDVLKAVNPLLAFRPLAPDIKQPVGQTGKLGMGGRETPAGVGTLVELRGGGRRLLCTQQASRGASLQAEG